MAFNIKNFFLNLFANSAIDVADNFFENFLESFYLKKPNNAIAFASALYIGIDTFAEDYAATTKTTVDDRAVAEFKKDIEEFAAKHGFVLQNLDED